MTFSLPMRQVLQSACVIPRDSKLRVAAYCRVSTETDEQATSYEAQIEHYTEYIKKNPTWEFAGIYADDGISGTNTKKKEEYNRLIDDCMAGQIEILSAVWIQSHDSFGNEPPFEYPLNPLILDRVA